MAVTSPFDDVEGVAVIAHRGASRAARENTVEAFAKARALRADAVELDVRRCADGPLVVHHDAVVRGAGCIVERSLDELRRRAPWVPTLEEAMAACDGMWVDIEVKNLPVDPDWDPDEGVATRVAEFVAAGGLHDRVVVSSFNPGALIAAREFDPNVPTALLTVGSFDAVVAVETAAEAGHVASHPGVEALAGDRAARAVARGHELGLAVVPWTVDDPDEITRLAEAGVAGVITNVPDIARRALTSW